ncbi:GNAT family N-acetyltransferase [Serratia sp. Se-RSBMAAmG]|uniref:GNAT family N-acetyltransferase n=1 Tax=Serratia sp. Se-RSBMAAmG TaxID=3043305 RepID=UPI0024AF8BC1|nr:GNAT family N-acetyltransferase [Serratia sp. Se-RSBMAAmG]MDI6976106.1 GNAT family N-acetyltransferase [Serratia sp. Se-RSBMAAmG]
MNTEKLTSLFSLNELLPTLATLNDIYPDISHWYFNKVIPRVLLGEDAVIIVKNTSGQMAGFAIAKKTESESKLCCLYILPEFRGQGYVIPLIENVIEELDNDYPHCSVSEDLFHAYSKIFINYFRWRLDEVVSNVYKKGKLEYFFNGKRKEDSYF